MFGYLCKTNSIFDFLQKILAVYEYLNYICTIGICMNINHEKI